VLPYDLANKTKKRAGKPWIKQWNLNYTPGTKFEDPEANCAGKRLPKAKGKFDITIPDEPTFLKSARISTLSHKSMGGTKKPSKREEKVLAMV
jgi:hypothetical protein